MFLSAVSEQKDTSIVSKEKVVAALAGAEQSSQRMSDVIPFYW